MCSINKRSEVYSLAFSLHVLNVFSVPDQWNNVHVKCHLCLKIIQVRTCFAGVHNERKLFFVSHLRQDHSCLLDTKSANTVPASLFVHLFLVANEIKNTFHHFS